MARSSAASMPSVTKWNVVPPSISSGSRGWCVITKTGVWKGGSSPHHPFHGSSPQGPSPPPNMCRPITVAPMFSSDSATTSSSGPVAPPSMPWTSRKLLTAKTHSWRPPPPSPSGFSTLWLGPAT